MKIFLKSIYYLFLILMSPPVFAELLNSWPSYATLKNPETPVYSSIEAARKRNPVRIISQPRINLSLKAPGTALAKELDEAGLVMINPQEFVYRKDLKMVEISKFAGLQFDTRPISSFGWTIETSLPMPRPGLVAGKGNAIEPLPFNSLVEIVQTKVVGDQKWIQIKDRGWLPENTVALFQMVRRPKEISANEKWIHVSISNQTLAAYEGDRLVYATLMSSGRRAKETKRGLFRIYNRLERAKMEGDPGPDYFLFEDIPYHLYFYKHQAIHGAYTRERFGHKGSHGCINLSLTDAKWLWEWTGGSFKAGHLGPDLDPPIEGQKVWIQD